MLQVAKLSDQATIPTRATVKSAGYDLYSAIETSVPPHGKCLIYTDLQIKVPLGTYGRIAGRSGLSLKNHIRDGFVKYSQ